MKDLFDVSVAALKTTSTKGISNRPNTFPGPSHKVKLQSHGHDEKGHYGSWEGCSLFIRRRGGFTVSVTEFGVSGASLSFCWDDCVVVSCSWARLDLTAGFIPENTQQLSLQTLTDANGFISTDLNRC